MSARDELAKLMFVTDNESAADPDHEWEMTTRHNPMYSEYAFAMADAILAAGYRRPRTITTAEELDALPDGSVIRDKFNDVSERRDGMWCGYETAPLSDQLVKKYLPATVLYEPEQP